MNKGQNLIVSVFILLLLTGDRALPNELHDNIRSYQEALIRSGVTGSSIAGVFRGAKTLAISTVSSSLKGDKAVTEDTIFPIWSMSKPITIAAMMILLDRDAYNLDDPVKEYISYFDGIKCKDDNADLYPCENDLLIKHLLTHRSGYGYYGELGGGRHGPVVQDSFLNLDEFVRHAASHPVEFEPGTEYLYGINQAILGRLIEVLTGQGFYEFLKKELFDPLGMKETKFHLTSEDRKRFQPLFRKEKAILGRQGLRRDLGNAGITKKHDELNYPVGTKAQFGGEGLVSTFSDYRKFCEMLLAGGRYNNVTIISKKSFDLMTTVVTPHQISSGYDSGFGYSFSMFSLEEPLLDGTGSPKGIFGWSGYHNTHFWIDQTNSIFGLFMTRTTPSTWEIQKQFRAAVYDVLRLINK